MYTIDFYPGDGTKVQLQVDHDAVYARDTRGRCAFCHGDPLGEDSPPTSLIAQYYERNPRAETCPCCQGRAT